MEIFGNLNEFLKHAGHIGIIAIIFAESGILAGFFLPGDSLLLTAGFLASAGYLNIWTPYAELIHYESESRGSDQKPETFDRFQKEEASPLNSFH